MTNKALQNATQFLHAMNPDGPWPISVLKEGKMHTRTFSKAQIHDIQPHLDKNAAHNIYFQHNPVLRELKKKAARTDIKAVTSFHVDIDPIEGFDVAEEQARILALLTTDLPKGVPEPSCIVFSGGGYQAFWFLEVPIPINGDIGLAEDAKLYNMQLEFMFGADHCHNVDRILRLPYTMNNPGSKKRAAGRVPTMAELVKWNPEKLYSVDDFKKAKPTANSVSLDDDPVEITAFRIPDAHEIEQLARKHGQVDYERLLAILNDGRLETPKEYDDSRSAWIFDATCNLHRIGLETGAIMGAISNRDWGISDSVYRTRDGEAVPNPMGYAARQVRRAVNAVDNEVPADEQERDASLEFMNEHHAVLHHEGGKTRVLTWDYSEVDQDRLVAITQSFPDIANMYCNKQVWVPGTKGGEPKPVELGKWWLHHPKRTEYHALRFDPSNASRVIELGSKRYLNLWQGFGVDAAPGEWTKMYHHMKNVLACRNEEHFRYILRWAAWTVQNPANPAEVALVFKGGKGTGKGFFGRTMRRLFGQHGLHISSSKHLTSNFNSHLRDCVLLFADEAILPNNKDGEAVLKTLITEDTLTIEGKGKDLITAPNRMHLILASNNDFVVPATHDERRFAVFEVPDADRHRQRPYFDALAAELQNGGYEAMLHDLLAMELGDWHPRNDVPKSSALREQQLENLDPLTRWVLGLLKEGILPGNVPTRPKDVDPYARLNLTIYEEIRETTPELRHMSNDKLADGLTPWFGKSVRFGDRMGRVIPPLGKLRAIWDERLWPMEWDTADCGQWNYDPESDTQQEVPF